MKKVLIPGLVAGVVMLVVGMLVSILFSAAFPASKAEYENTCLFRSWSDPIMYLYFIYPFFIGIALAWVWNRVKGLVAQAGVFKRGFFFGLAFWVVSTFPGILISYSSFPISLLTAVSWLISAFVQLICAGMVYAKMNKLIFLILQRNKRLSLYKEFATDVGRKT